MDKLGPYELNTAVLGDCLEVLGQIPDNSVDSIVTDSPYGLGNDPDMAEMLDHWLNDKDYDTGPGFMSRDWDIVPGPAIWRECYRVMKPGGCLMAFGGTRTCDLLSIAIRLAGFEKFDELCWIHSQGFAKGIAIDKGIDSLLGKAGEREVVDHIVCRKQSTAHSRHSINIGDKGDGKCSREWDITAPATEAAAQWEGWRSQLKPSHEVILCFWKPREGSFAKNALKYGVSGLWIDGCRIATNGEIRERHNTLNKPNAEVNFNTCEIKVNVSREWGTGRYPANVLLSHDPRCVRRGEKRVRSGMHGNAPGGYAASNLYGDGDIDIDVSGGYADPDGYETVPDYECHPDCAVAMLDQMSGQSKSSPVGFSRAISGNDGHEGYQRKGHEKESYKNPSKLASNYNDSGGASRFFYSPKAPGREKWFYCQICDDCYPYTERDDHAHGKPKGKRKHQIAHPTVKPLTIVNYTLGVLEYLCRLTKTPTGGIVLDPFGGSGTTALAAIANGRDFLVIEKDEIYHRIAKKRIEQALKEPRQLELL